MLILLYLKNLLTISYLYYIALIYTPLYFLPQGGNTYSVTQKFSKKMTMNI